MVMTNLRRQDSNTFWHVTVPLHGNFIDSSMLVGALLPHAVKVNVPLFRIFHLDVSPSVRKLTHMSLKEVKQGNLVLPAELIT